jgi:hypothetical protein
MILMLKAKQEAQAELSSEINWPIRRGSAFKISLKHPPKDDTENPVPSMQLERPQEVALMPP